MPKSKKESKIKEVGKVYGYLRVSTEGQNLDNNKDVILKKKEDLGLLGPIEWIEEKISGTVDWKKRELGEYYNKFNNNDVLIMSELSRISRKYLEMQEFVSVTNKKGVKIYSLDVPVVLDGSMQSNMYLSMIGLGAQLEREYISTRTKNALAKKKKEYEEENKNIEDEEKRKNLGRPKGSTNKTLKLDPYKKVIKDKILSGVNLKRIAEDYGVSHQSVCNYVKKHNLKPLKKDNKKDEEPELQSNVEIQSQN